MTSKFTYLIDTTMPDNITFTDITNQAHNFIKELYIGSDWNHEDNGNDLYKMVLYQAFPCGASIEYSITIGIHSSCSQGVMHDGFTVSNNSSTGPIKLEGVGIFAGVDCYVVVDWDLLSAIAMMQNRPDGSAWFEAEVYMNVATDINNSPTIKRHFFERALLNLTPPSLQRFELNRGTWTPVTTNTTVNVSDEVGLAAAILNNNSVTINLMADILMQGNTGLTAKENDGTTTSLIRIDSKNVIINSNNGHKIFDYAHRVTCATPPQDGRCHFAYSEPVLGNETFVTEDGQILHLARSQVYQAQGWYTAESDNYIYGLSLPDELESLQISENDDVFISYRVSYERFTKKVKSCSGGIIKFEIAHIDPDDPDYNPEKDPDRMTRNQDMRALSPNTHFFLTNMSGIGGITIKNGILSYPSDYPEFSICEALYIFRIKGTSRVEINGVKIIGGTEYGIMNTASVKISLCEMTNIGGGGLYNRMEAYADQCVFHDFLTSALRNEHYPESSDLPYLEATNNVFRNNGHYGTNDHAVRSNGNAYIARNEFVDTNYSAILIGKVNCSDCDKLPSNLVEYNFIHYTQEWIDRRKVLGLQDSGDIYIPTNNLLAIVRFNRIIGTGGIGGINENKKNNAIYADDGAYNVKIYGNVISGTENYFDIDCRDGSKKGEIKRTIPLSEHVSTNNYIAYNICDGYLRMQENMNDIISQTGCLFLNNFIVPRHTERLESSVRSLVNKLQDYNNGDAIVTDSEGIVAAAMLIALSDGDDMENVSEE